ncbi:hypothetical protein HF086_015440 [Spodoptera exigua]|uniref:Spondin-1 n=1 Tax=Spodoptera exigua TaxID=7107 RepID=A0A922MV71_SPOEX|nr:hypothetical protein HF086_015440 [Spodoptera exigua]
MVRLASGFRCDRRPYGSNTQPSEPDGRFKLEIVGVDNNAYIPEQLYTVQITETDGQSHFTSFMISAEGDIKPDPKNPRRLISMYPGELRPQTTTTAKYSDRCLYSVEQAMASYKTSVSVYWQAPSSGNGCVTLRAMVAINDEVWYEDGVPLTQKVCEDLRQPDDVAPQLNLECGICDEAKYELTFTGIWSRNTHPYLYPENDWLPRYSDLVGASHNADYILWMPGNLASEGFRDLAEHANSSVLEAEIRGKIGDGVRTLIKGKGHGYRKMFLPTYSFFRVDKENHLFSAVVAFTPSPDWFLGVTRFELCQEDNTWLKERELNLFPWDAGTDSGVSYESPNIVTYPQDSISRVEMSSYDKNSPFYEVDMKDMHPFGKFHIKLIRTYHRDCEEESTEESPATEAPKTSEEEPAETSEEAKPEPPEPSRYQTQLDSAEDGRHHPRKEVSKYCKAHVATFEKEACEDECTNSEEEDDLTGRHIILCLILLLKTCACSYEVCDRRPLGTNTDPLPPDNRFLIDVYGIRDNMYIPKEEYSVRLFSRDGVSSFIAFTISIREDTTENKNNPRKPILLSPGKLEPLPNSNNTKAKWTAPEKDNKCVTVFAVVAVRPDVWYSFEGPLSQRICEDRRKADDMQPMENYNCQVCEDARYKLIFEGMWSYNTHPTMYPPEDLVARFSDVVGASHSNDFSPFKYNSDATDGLKLLAEQGNTTNLEVEIYQRLGTDVRTVIKARAPPSTNMKTISTFRASRKHHMVSLATAIVPSPDWFLGVANLELCDAKTHEWADNVIFNLYPMDAGTDSGKKFDSSNEATAPPQPISTAKIDANIPKEQLKPFARLVFQLIRTYYNPNCTEETTFTEETGGEGESGDNTDDGSDEGEYTNRVDNRPSPPTSTTSEEPPSIDPDSSPECPMTPWEDWQECAGECIDNKLNGYQIRFRYHVGDPSPECLKMPLTDMQNCEEECEEEAAEGEEEEEEEEEEE